MAMTTMPDVKRVPGGTLWSNTYNLFTARVYTPENDLPGQVINLGFKAPCLTVPLQCFYHEPRFPRHTACLSSPL